MWLLGFFDLETLHLVEKRSLLLKLIKTYENLLLMHSKKCIKYKKQPKLYKENDEKQ